MNIYLQRYNKLISHYKTLTLEGYTETHHILPRCMGGDNSPENLVKLTAKAHFVAHHLLCKAYPNNRKLLHAFGRFVQSNDRIQRQFTARMYDQAKKAISEAVRGTKRPYMVERNKARKGEKRSEEHKRKVSEKLKGRKLTDEHKAKLTEANRKKAKDPQFIEKLRQSTLSLAQDPEYIQKLKDAARKRSDNPEYIEKLKGPKSPEHKAKIKAAQTHLLRPQYVKCPQCGHEGKHSANIYRYHFKNCKSTPFID
jgi:hypothetical protein